MSGGPFVCDCHRWAHRAIRLTPILVRPYDGKAVVRFRARRGFYRPTRVELRLCLGGTNRGFDRRKHLSRSPLPWPESHYIRMLFSTTLYSITVSTTDTTLLMAMLTAQFRALM